VEFGGDELDVGQGVGIAGQGAGEGGEFAVEAEFFVLFRCLHVHGEEGVCGFFRGAQEEDISKRVAFHRGIDPEEKDIVPAEDLAGDPHFRCGGFLRFVFEPDLHRDQLVGAFYNGLVCSEQQVSIGAILVLEEGVFRIDAIRSGRFGSQFIRERFVIAPGSLADELPNNAALRRVRRVGDGERRFCNTGESVQFVAGVGIHRVAHFARALEFHPVPAICARVSLILPDDFLQIGMALVPVLIGLILADGKSHLRDQDAFFNESLREFEIIRNEIGILGRCPVRQEEDAAEDYQPRQLFL